MDGPGALRLARALRNATQHAAALFGQDVRSASQLLARVLQHESGRQGFELAATRDADFHQVGGRGPWPWGQDGALLWGWGCEVTRPPPRVPRVHWPCPPQGFSLAPPPALEREAAAVSTRSGGLPSLRDLGAPW